MTQYIPFDEYIKSDNVQTSKLKDKLIKENIKEHMCECCFNTMWNGEKITLEVHHKNGNRKNNELDNLQLLCPNCHAMTDNWRGRGKKNQKTKDGVTDEEFLFALKESDNIRQALLKLNLLSQGRNYDRAKRLCEENGIVFEKQKDKSSSKCIDCGKEIQNTATRCKECENKLRKQEGLNDLPISREELKQLIRETSFVQIGKMFKVSDNTIRKWCKKLNLPCRSYDIKKISNEDWISI